MSQQINKSIPKKRKELSDYEKGLIIGGALHNISLTAISEKTGIPMTTVHSTVQRWKQNGTPLTEKRQGRPSILGERDLRQLKNEMKKDRNATLGELTNAMRLMIGKYICKNTIRKAIRKIGMSSCHPVFKPRLSRTHKKKRLLFAKRCKETNQRWDRVIWSDESRFMVFPKDGNLRIWRFPLEKFKSDCIMPRVQFGGGSVMVWGCVWAGGVGPLKTIINSLDQFGYINLLERKLLPFYGRLSERHDGEFIYQEDNAPCHKSKLVENWKKTHNVPIMEWPPNSPDLSPIENLWAHLGRMVRARVPAPRTIKELDKVIHEEWKKIPVAVCKAYCMSMPTRIARMKKARGDVTKY